MSGMQASTGEYFSFNGVGLGERLRDTLLHGPVTTASRMHRAIGCFISGQLACTFESWVFVERKGQV